MRSKQPLKATRGLKASKGLRASKGLKARAKPKKQVKPSITKLEKEADQYFSLYILYRDGTKEVDGSWWATCITCYTWKMFIDSEGKLDKRPIHWGHFQSQRFHPTKYHEQNVNAQCQSCNIWNKGEQYKYGVELDLKYGIGTAKQLHELAHTSLRFTEDYLKQIILAAQDNIAFYEHSY